jgi:hypothetical protein
MGKAVKTKRKTTSVRLASNGKLPARRNILRAPRSSWISFLSHVRAEKRENLKNIGFGALCQQLSPEWTQMSVEDKRPYVEMYLSDRERYYRQLKDLSIDGIRILRAHKRARRKKRIGRPKAAMSSYMLFVATERKRVVESHPEISFQAIGRELGRRWRELPETDRHTYSQTASVDRVRFDRELLAWKTVQKDLKLKLKLEKSRT